MSEWNGIKGFDAWAAKLRTLLVAAADASKAADQSARMDLSERLIQFVENSFPNDDPMKALDEIATKAAVGLLEQNMDERLKSIAGRNGELARLTKELARTTASAEKTAAHLRLERINSTVVALNDGIVKIKTLRDTLETGTDAELLAALDKALQSAQAARGLLEKS